MLLANKYAGGVAGEIDVPHRVDDLGDIAQLEVGFDLLGL